MKCPSGLRSTPGKCVYRKLYREFESLLHRHILKSPANQWFAGLFHFRLYHSVVPLITSRLPALRYPKGVAVSPSHTPSISQIPTVSPITPPAVSRSVLCPASTVRQVMCGGWLHQNRLQAKQGMGFIIVAINNLLLIAKKMLHQCENSA